MERILNIHKILKELISINFLFVQVVQCNIAHFVVVLIDFKMMIIDISFGLVLTLQLCFFGKMAKSEFLQNFLSTHFLNETK